MASAKANERPTGRTTMAKLGSGADVGRRRLRRRARIRSLSMKASPGRMPAASSTSIATAGEKDSARPGSTNPVKATSMIRTTDATIVRWGMSREHLIDRA